jgi:starvation-inducible DNA-binding protein
MATQTAPFTRTTLGEEARRTAAEALQAQLSELIDMTLKGKQAHWNVTGPNFRSVHLQLDEIVDSLRGWSDRVGERVVTLGYSALGGPDAAQQSRLQPLPQGTLPDRDVVRLMADCLATCIERSRQRAQQMGDVDLVSQNILLDIIEGMEMHLWMLQAQEA